MEVSTNRLVLPPSIGVSHRSGQPSSALRTDNRAEAWWIIEKARAAPVPDVAIDLGIEAEAVVLEVAEDVLEVAPQA